MDMGGAALIQREENHDAAVQYRIVVAVTSRFRYNGCKTNYWY